MLAVPAVALPILLLCAAFCLWRCCTRNKHPGTPSTSSSAGSKCASEHLQPVPMGCQSNVEKPLLPAHMAPPISLQMPSPQPLPQTNNIPAQWIRYTGELGHGTFGPYYDGELASAEGQLIVVVKTIMQTASPAARGAFTRETEVHQYLTNANVARMLGTVAGVVGVSAAVYENAQSDLYSYLRGRQHPQHPPQVDDTRLLHIAAEVACGLRYLASKDFVHRDVSARNVAVSANRVFLTDSARARTQYSCDYVTLKGHEQRVPLRWMPAEAIRCEDFGLPADIWSFGVLLWELYTFGERPYAGWTDEDVLSTAGSSRLSLPAPCKASQAVYTLMTDCWHASRAHRPVAADVAEALCAWRASSLMAGVGTPATVADTHATLSTRSSHSDPSNSTVLTGVNSPTLTDGATSNPVGMQYYSQPAVVRPLQRYDAAPNPTLNPTLSPTYDGRSQASSSLSSHSTEYKGHVTTHPLPHEIYSAIRT